MNSLSWFLYLAGVIPNFAIFASIIGIIGTFVCLVTWTISRVAQAQHPEEHYQRELTDKQHTVLRDSSRYALFITVPLLLMSFILPSERTMYLIAASQFGEQLAATPDAKALYGQLKTKIESYLTVDKK